MKDLIYIDGQEGFVDLDFFIQIDTYNNYLKNDDYIDALERSGWYNFSDNKLVKQLIENPDKDKKMGWVRVGSSDNMKCPYGRWVKVTNHNGINLKRRITVLNISRNNVSREYSKVFNFYNKEIDYWNKKIEHYRTIKRKDGNKDSYYRKNKIKECTKNIRRIFRLKHKNPWVADYDEELRLVYKLIKKCPKKFYTIYSERFEDNNDKLRFDIWLLMVSSKIIPYLEQQIQLKRITVKKDEYKMLFALKEAMRIKDEKTTFDDYINNWTEKLLGKEFIEFARKKDKKYHKEYMRNRNR